MQNVEYSAKTYYTDTSFDYDTYFNYSLGIYHYHNQSPINVKLEFYDNYIETVQNHPLMSTQKSKLVKGGKVLLVELEVYDSKELISEILKYGNLVKVISPESVVKRIKETLKNTAKFY